MEVQLLREVDTRSINPIETKSKGKKNFDFVDTIRGIAMFGIVLEHSIDLSWIKYSDFFSTFIQASVVQSFKFSTIAFFLISGFLINYKFAEYSPLQYLKKRFKNTIGPWLLWLHVFLVMGIVDLWNKYRKSDLISPLKDDFLTYLGKEYYTIVTGTSFWFVLNFLICIALLLIFKKYLYKIWFGVVLGLISLVYSFNIYFEWFITLHTTAVFGFVFFLWLGVYLNRHYDLVTAFINATSMAKLIAVTCLFFLLANIEIVYLKFNNIEDAYNTLRISNILYSLSFFALLLKLGAVSWINKVLEPRKTTYGVYLIHQIVISYLLREILRPFHVSIHELSILLAVAYGLARFVLAYLITSVIVKTIVRTKFRWSIGG